MTVQSSPVQLNNGCFGKITIDDSLLNCFSVLNGKFFLEKKKNSNQIVYCFEIMTNEIELTIGRFVIVYLFIYYDCGFICGAPSPSKVAESDFCYSSG